MAEHAGWSGPAGPGVLTLRPTRASLEDIGNDCGVIE